MSPGEKSIVDRIFGMNLVEYAPKKATMLRKLLLLLFSIIIQAPIQAQTDSVSRKNFSPRNYAEFHLTQLLVNQAHIAYGRFIHPRWSLESELGAKWKWKTRETYSIDPDGLLGDLAAELHQMPFANSYYMSLFGVYHFKSVTPYSTFDPYVSFGGFYRYSFYRHANIYFDEHDAANDLRNQSEYHYIPGVKVLGGTRILFSNESKLKILVDLYAGLGLRWKKQKTIIHGFYDYVHTYTETFPALHLGVKIGAAW